MRYILDLTMQNHNLSYVMQTLFLQRHIMAIRSACVALALVWFATSPPLAHAGPDTAQAPPPSVTVEKVLIQETNPITSYVGRVEAIQAVDLQPRVEGYLEVVNVDEGSEVNADDTLFVIEQHLYKAQVNADSAAVDKARAMLDKAQKYLQRLRATRKNGVAAADLDAAVSDHLQAKAQLHAALAALERSKLNLQYTTITAPIHGRIGRVQVTRGNLVTPATGPLARIVQVDPIRIVFSLNEQEYLELQRRLTQLPSGEQSLSEALVLRLLLSDGTEYPRQGRMDFVDNEIDPLTGTIAIRAEFDNPEQLLLPGAYGTVQLRQSEPVKYPLVPQAAVQEDKDGRYVLLVDENNTVVMRRIVTGTAVGPSWAVQQGLEGGETVIVYGLQKARIGKTVAPKLDASRDQE